MKINKIFFLLISFISSLFINSSLAEPIDNDFDIKNSFSKDGLPCIDSVCIGDNVDQVNISLETIPDLKSNISYKLDFSKELESKKINDDIIRIEYDAAITALSQLDEKNSLI